VLNIASTLTNHLDEIIQSRDRLYALYQAVDWPGDLPFGTWPLLYAICLEFAPDCIIELGRGRGNSTCVLAEAANHLGSTRVISIGYDSTRDWQTSTAPRLADIVKPGWFDALEILHQDILETDFQGLLSNGTRILFFWDAHGAELANYILGVVFPLLQEKQHIVLVHDITDARYTHNNDARFDSPMEAYYRNDGVRQTWMGHLVCPFEELIPLYDFLSRNRIVFETPDHFIHQELTRDPEWGRPFEVYRGDWEKQFAKESVLKRSPFIPSHLVYFDLDEKQVPQGDNVFPVYTPRAEPLPPSPVESQPQGLTRRVLRLLTGKSSWRG
jgi:hypothetical protein